MNMLEQGISNKEDISSSLEDVATARAMPAAHELSPGARAAVYWSGAKESTRTLTLRCNKGWRTFDWCAPFSPTAVGELILNIIALGIAGVMLFNFLYAKGWWQKFCQPLLDWMLKISQPLLSFLGTYLWPAWNWWAANVYDFNHFEFLFENLTIANETNASLSTKIRKNNTDFLNSDPFKQDIFAEARGDVSRQRWISEASEAVELLRSAEFAEQPVRFVCEAQMLLNDVYQVRKRMHEVSAARALASRSGVSPSGLAALCSRVLSLAAAARLPQPYKGLRADTAEQLYKDMLSETLKVAKAKQEADDTSTPLKAAAARGDIEAAAALVREATAAEREAAFVVAVGKPCRESSAARSIGLPPWS